MCDGRKVKLSQTRKLNCRQTQKFLSCSVNRDFSCAGDGRVSGSSECVPYASAN